MTLVLKSVRLGSEAVSIVIDDGKISAIEASSDTLPSGSEVVDLDGAHVFPGFIDLQINGSFGHDFVNDPESIWKVAARLPETGTTAFLPTLVTTTDEKINAAIKVLRDGPPEGFRGATPLGIHAEGPFLAPAKKGAHDGGLMRHPKERPDWLNSPWLKMLTLAPELEGASELIAELGAKGVIVSAGHTVASAQQILGAAKEGLSYGTHLFNAMSGVSHRDPGAATGLLMSDSLTCGLIVDGIHVDPLMIAMAWKLKGKDRINLVTDAMAGAGMPEGDYKLSGYDVVVKDGAVRLPDGTLAGSALTLDAAVRNLITQVGCGLEDAVHTVTEVPVRLLNRGVSKVAVGSHADLTLLSDRGNVVACVCGGAIAFAN